MLDTQELAPVAIAFLLSVIGGIGTFLMDVRDGRQSGNLLGLVTEIFVAVTAGAVAYRRSTVAFQRHGYAWRLVH